MSNGLSEPEGAALAKAGNWAQLANSGHEGWNAVMEWLRTRPKKWRPNVTMRSLGDRNDFSGFIFLPNFSFHGFQCATGASFEGAVFEGDADFRNTSLGGIVSFEGAVFEGDADFSPAAFVKGEVNFGKAEFKRKANFIEATFQSMPSFAHARFSGHALFDRARFPGDASFLEATFTDTTSFSGATFDGTATFDGARFEGDFGFTTGKLGKLAWFQNVRFKEDCSFIDVNFGKGTSFEGARFEQGASFVMDTFDGTADFGAAEFGDYAEFSGTRFEGGASFSRCVFERPPAFMETTFKHSPSFAQADFWFHADPWAIVRYRRLKKLAAEAHDHRSELNLFALESRARRATALSWKSDWAELLLGYLYEAASDYGRSVRRPFVGLVTTFAAGMFGFAFVAGKGWPAWGWDWTVAAAALASLLPFAGQSVMARKVIQEGLCRDLVQAEQLDCFTWVYFVSAIEGFVAVIFLFLLGLGLRNLFRIK